MILVDFSQVMISNIMMQLANNQQKLEESMVRHMVLSSLRMYKQKFPEYGEIVICCDGPSYWRRQVFPHYKANRKKNRDSSGHDWSLIFDSLHKIRDEMRDNMPYPVLIFDRAEADDVIASLCHAYGETMNLPTAEKILILSSDKDFAQLQKYANVQQYSPIMKKHIAIDNPERFKQYHILQGDSGDGVPNFLSVDDTFVSGGRQKPLPKKKLEEWTTLQPEAYCTGEMLRNYYRNKKMVDLDEVPEELQTQCVEAFRSYERQPRSKILNYFIQNRLRNLTENIGDF